MMVSAAFPPALTVTFVHLSVSFAKYPVGTLVSLIEYFPGVKLLNTNFPLFAPEVAVVPFISFPLLFFAFVEQSNPVYKVKPAPPKT